MGLCGAAFLLLVHFLEIGIDHLFAAGLRALRAAVAALPVRARRAAGRRGLRLVKRLAGLHRGLGQRLGLGPDLAQIAAADHALELGDRGLDRLLGIGGNLVAAVFQGFFARVDQGFGLVLGLDLLAALLVFLGMGLGVLHHLADVVLAEPARG